MQYNFSPLKARVKEIEDWLKKEQSQVRTGRATPAFLDSVRVESYGSYVPLNQVGNITLEDPRTLRVTPWDMSQTKEIEKAVATANLGVSTAVDERGVRIAFPELTSETRQNLVKIAKAKLEEVRIALRAEREKTWDEIQAREKEGGMTEDEKFRFKNDMQKLIDETNKKLEEMHEKKEKDILS